MATGDKIKAVTVAAYVNTGTDASPTWTKVGGQKNATLTFKQAMDDTTTKDSTELWEDVMPGARSWAIKCDCLKVDTDAGQDALIAGFMAASSQKFTLRWKTDTSAKWQGSAYISNLEEGAPEKGSATFKVDFNGTGKPTKDPTP